MATSVQDILDAAYGCSTKNAPAISATEQTELLQVVTRMLQGYYAFAARVNPTFFGETATLTLSGGRWALPTAAESVFRLEDENAAEVISVPYDDRKVESGKPSVYVMGGYYYPAGNASDPTGNLTAYYSKRPAVLAALTDNLDATWPEQFNHLLVTEVALYLAAKDSGEQGRAQEVQVLLRDRERWAKLLAAHLEHKDAAERARFAMRRINTNTMVPLSQLLSGGT